jgi:lysophospholipase L1-like esterase
MNLSPSVSTRLAGRRRPAVALLLGTALLIAVPGSVASAAVAGAPAGQSAAQVAGQAVGQVAAQAIVAARPPAIYAALGDSFSAGVGTGQADVAGPPCLRSSLAYPQLWARDHVPATLTDVACSGATIPSVLAHQVSQIPHDATQVTVTMGGNDVGFSAVIAVCTAVPNDFTCSLAVGLAKTAAVTEVPVAMGITLTAIRHAAPHARLLVLGYPRLFELGTCSGVPDAKERKAINDGTDLLDGAISRAASLFGARFVDVRDRFAGHGVCAPAGQSWINGPGNSTESYHPNRTGQIQGYLAALTQVTG